MIYIIPLSFFIIVAIDAYTDTNRTVNHKRGALIYTIACVVLSLFYLKFTDIHWYYLASFALLTRLAFFDPIWNWMNGQNFTYNGDPNKPKDKRSLIDWIENKLGLSIFWLRIIYIIKYTGFLTFYFLYA